MTGSSRIFPALAVATVLTITTSLPAHAAWGSRKKAAELAGAALYRDKGCAHCHGADGSGTRKAPPLKDIRKKKEWTPDKMTHQILNGGRKMPPFADSLTDQEVAQVIAYLRAKHKPVPPPASEAAAATE